MDFMSPEEIALALKLQREFDSGVGNTQGSHGHTSSPLIDIDKTPDVYVSDPDPDLNNSGSWSLVDKRWEIIDPIPDIRVLFLEFNEKYFWGKLAGIEVKWSPKMTLCAGLCVYQGKASGFCSVRLSEPLLKLRPRKDLIETLLDHDGHGPEFHKHMYRLNSQTGTNISVYHTFHDEVDNYRQHWWKCDGPCQHKPPYFGMVKRAMNRPPTARDPWWPQHQQTCGGTYTKVKEPEGYKDKKKKAEEKALAKKNDGTDTDEQDEPIFVKFEADCMLEKGKGNVDIRSMFGGGGNKTGTGSKVSKPTATVTSGSELTGSGFDSQPSGSKQPSGSSSKGAPSGSGDQNIPGAKPKANIHGFNNTDLQNKPGSTENFRGNMHGFGKLGNSESGTESDSKTLGRPIKSFEGKGKTLGSSSGSINGPIVRKIPGIGTITTERPVSHSHMSSDSEQGTSKSSGTHSRSDNINGAVPGSNNVINYCSDDSDFDDVLDKILKPKKESALKKSHSSSVLEAGNNNKRPKGFKSVSNVRRHSDPDRWKKLDKMDRARRAAAAEAEKNQRPSKASIKRKLSSNDSLAADRNKRVCYITSSESDSDLDENATLASVFTSGSKKDKAKAKPIESDQDSDYVYPGTKSDSEDSDFGGKSAFDDIKIPTRKIDNDEGSSRGVGSPVSEVATPMSVSPPPAAPIEVNDELRDCPVCSSKVPESQMNSHLDECLSRQVMFD